MKAFDIIVAWCRFQFNLPGLKHGVGVRLCLFTRSTRFRFTQARASIYYFFKKKLRNTHVRLHYWLDTGVIT